LPARPRSLELKGPDLVHRIAGPPTPLPSGWAPLHHAVFRSLWIAGVASNFGAFMHEVGQGWVMTMMTSSPLKVALLQSAESLPIFLLVIPAGALADVVDHRRLAIIAQAWMLAMATTLGVLTLTHRMTPALLIGLTLVMGIGAAVDDPLWQAIISEVVPRRELPQAVTLEQPSLSWNGVAGVPDAVGGVGGGDRAEGHDDGLFECLEGAGGEAAQDGFDLRPDHLDRVEVRGVGREEDQFSARSGDHGSHACALVGAEVVHHHQVAGPKLGNDELFDVGLEDVRVEAADEAQRRDKALAGEARAERDVVAPVLGH
jgi:hypothetical protein